MELSHQARKDSSPDENYRDLPDYSANPLALPSTIAVSGSTGLIGSMLVPLLRARGHRVIRLVRSRSNGSGSDTLYWDPAKGEIDRAGLEGIDSVVHLAGESLGGLWSQERKRTIMESRKIGTHLLSECLSGLTRRPKALVSASAVGYYGDRGSEPLDEGSSAGVGFLPKVCQAWEKACRPAAEAGIRVVNLRFGIVLSPVGGILRTMLVPFKLGLGGTLGQGKQYMSWVAIDDLARVVFHLLGREDISGPVNVTTPEPVSNRDFSRTLAKVVRRPMLFEVPAPILRLAPGQMAEEMLLTSVRVFPRRLIDSGFVFHYPQLEQALLHLTGKPREDHILT